MTCCQNNTSANAKSQQCFLCMHNTIMQQNSFQSATLHVQIKQGYCTGDKGVFTPIALEPGHSKSLV